MKTYGKELLLLIVMLAAAVYLFGHTKPGQKMAWQMGLGKVQNGNQKTDGQTAVEDCTSETFTMQDEWLSGVIDKNQKFEAITNWRECGLTIVSQAIVLYRVSKSHEPVARIVAAAPNDNFKLRQPPAKNFWHIEINSDLFMETEENPYHFGSHAPPALKIYHDAHDGKLDAASVVLLSRKSPGDQDSGSLGVLNVADIVAIVRRP